MKNFKSEIFGILAGGLLGLIFLLFKQPPFFLSTNFPYIPAIFLVLSTLFFTNLLNTFSIKIPSKKELIQAICGSFLISLGILLCNGGLVTGFYYKLCFFSLNGLLTGFGILVGLFICIPFYVKELEKKKETKGLEIRIKKINLFLALMGLGLVLFLAFKFNWLFLLLGLLGIIAEEGNLCIVSGIKEVFLSGKGSIARGIVLSVFFAFLFTFLVPYIYPNLSIQKSFSLAPWIAFGGGILLGIGMFLSGGDTLSLFWKTGKGYLSSFISLFGIWIFLELFNFFKLPFLVEKLFAFQPLKLSDYLGKHGTLILIALLSLVFYLLLYYNEKTKKWVKPLLF